VKTGESPYGDDETVRQLRRLYKEDVAANGTTRAGAILWWILGMAAFWVPVVYALGKGEGLWGWWPF
jgi:hypothetical protein